MNSDVTLSSTFQSDMTSVPTPAFLKARCRPYSPSDVGFPWPDLQAESTTMSVLLKSRRAMSLAVRIPPSTPLGNDFPNQAALPPYMTSPESDIASV